MRNPAWAAVVVLVVAGLAAYAQAAQVTVTQIEASGSGQKVSVDPKLGDLAGVLPKQFRYSEYKFVSSTSSSVTAGDKAATWTLDNGKLLDVSLTGTEGEGANMRYILNVEVYTNTNGTRETVTKTSFKREKGKPSLLVLDGKTSGKALILAIKVE